MKTNHSLALTCLSSECVTMQDGDIIQTTDKVVLRPVSVCSHLSSEIASQGTA